MSAAIDEEVRRRLGEALEEYAKRLKAERDGGKNLRRTKSMCDIGDRDKEEDDRRVNTEPLDRKKKKLYESNNPYHQVLDHDYPDNVYAEVGRNLKSYDGTGIGKLQQTGQRVMSAEEYERDLDERIRMMSTANMRGDQRVYGKFDDDYENDSQFGGYKRRKNMRGRKGKYYSQVDDEDQTFLEQERRLAGAASGEEYEEDADEDKLGMIEEESNNSTQRKYNEEDTKLLNSK